MLVTVAVPPSPPSQVDQASPSTRTLVTYDVAIPSTGVAPETVVSKFTAVRVVDTCLAPVKVSAHVATLPTQLLLDIQRVQTNGTFREALVRNKVLPNGTNGGGPDFQGQDDGPPSPPPTPCDGFGCGFRDEWWWKWLPLFALIIALLLLCCFCCLCAWWRRREREKYLVNRVSPEPEYVQCCSRRPQATSLRGNVSR